MKLSFAFVAFMFVVITAIGVSLLSQYEGFPDDNGVWVLTGLGYTGPGVTARDARSTTLHAAPPPRESAHPPGISFGGSVPHTEIGRFVFDGGTSEELVSASGCDAATAKFWHRASSKWLTFIPASRVVLVNAAWNERFEGGVPPFTPLYGTCSGRS